MSLKTTSKNIIFGLLVACGVLLFLEAGARVVKTALDDYRVLTRQDWLRYSPVLGWEKRPNFKGVAAREYREFDSEGNVLRSEPVPDHSNQKVLLLGDSCTYGLNVPYESTFGAILDEKLDGVSIINLATPGYSSYQGLQLLKQVIASKPALIIASFSFNDRRPVVNKQSMDGEAHFQFMSKWSWVLGPLSLSYSFKGLNSLLMKEVDLREMPVRVPIDAYRSNLEEMERLSTEYGVPFMFLVLEDNPLFMSHIEQGLELVKQGLPNQAIKKFKESIVLHPLASELPKLFLARAYESLGHVEEASRTASIVPQLRYDGGANPLRLDSIYGQTMMSVAEKLGVTWFDARPILDEDPSVFFDLVHFDEDGHKKIADGLYEFIVKQGLLKFEPLPTKIREPVKRPSETSVLS